METEAGMRRIARDELARYEPYASVMFSAKFIRGLLNDADRLAALERAVIVREDVEAMGYEVPEGAVAYSVFERNGYRCPEWSMPDRTDLFHEEAPDIWPEIEAPFTLPIVSLREGE